MMIQRLEWPVLRRLSTFIDDRLQLGKFQPFGPEPEPFSTFAAALSKIESGRRTTRDKGLSKDPNSIRENKTKTPQPRLDKDLYINKDTHLAFEASHHT